VVLTGLTGIVGLAWVYLYLSAIEMDTMMALKPWSGLDFTLMFLMWATMMAAMMVPSVTPVVLLYAAVLRKIAPQQPYGVSVSAFFLGYVIVWSIFSLGATTLQWLLEQLALLSPMMTSSTFVFGGLLLMAAGVYQWTPAKDACLQHCRTPLEFIARSWRVGPGGALQMGTVHGFYCIGCCWALMGLLFVGGVMNLLWVAVIAVFVLLEKVAAMGTVFGRQLSGLGLVITGILFIVLPW
jgi:predicted metal-binding membrane protein